MYLLQPNGSPYYRTRNVAPQYNEPRTSDVVSTAMKVLFWLTLIFAVLLAGFYAFYTMTDIIPDGVIPEEICVREFDVMELCKFAGIGAAVGAVIGLLFTVGQVLTMRNPGSDPNVGPSKRQLRFSIGILFCIWFLSLAFAGLAVGVGIYCLLAYGIMPSEEITEFVMSDALLWGGIGAGIGAILGTVIWVFHSLRLENTENEYYNRFKEVRTALPGGNIIYDRAGYPMEIITPGRTVLSESRVWINDTYSSSFFGDLLPIKLGQIFLTNEALEFYDNDFIGRPFRSFIINLHDIAYVKSRCICKHKVAVYCKSGKYVFHVPLGTSVIWCNAIRYAMQYGSRSLGPTAPLR